MSTTNTPFEEGLDEIFDNYGMIGQLLSSNSAKTRDRDWLKAALTQLHKAAIREARLDENKQIMAASGYKDDTYSIRSYYFSRRIAALQKEVKEIK